MVEAASGSAGASRLQLRLASDCEALEPARQAVLDFLAPHALNPRTIFNVELVLEETLSNQIKYAFNGAAGRSIELTVQVDADRVAMRFEDDGVAFDPLRARAPVLPSAIEEAVPGGLGLMLVRKFAQSVDYERRDGRNCLTIAVARA